VLAPVALAVWWLWQRGADRLSGWRRQMDRDMLEALTQHADGGSPGPARWLLLAWALAVVAIAGPTWRLEPSPFADDAAPLMILLKADTSMDLPDPSPSRLERARLKIADIAAQRAGQRLGLIVYAGSAHLVLPPTRDTAVVEQMAAEISSDIMPVPGDRLDLAMLKAADILGGDAAGGSVIVLADSVGADPPAIAAAQVGSINFLAINSPGSPEADSVRSVARSLSAVVEPWTADDTDVSALTRAVARGPAARAGEPGTFWQESGWFLTPVIALIFLSAFRRERPALEHRA